MRGNAFTRNATPISTVTPFTYGDGDTYLRRLERLIKWLANLITVVDGQTEAIEEIRNALSAIEAEVDKELAENRAYTVEQIANVRAELLAAIGAATDAGSVFNPTNGSLHEPIAKVISDVYDNVRVHALFAIEYDELEYTVAQYDAIGFEARHYDLSPFTNTNSHIKGI